MILRFGLIWIGCTRKNHSPGVNSMIVLVSIYVYSLDMNKLANSRSVWLGPIPLSSAIIIGINTYMSKDLSSLKGCVNDARDIAKFLRKSLGLSYDQISTVFNERATRSRIIQFISSLTTNENIAINDPIVIYFAGHSMLDDTGTACIIPYDYPEAQVITSGIINDVLAQVAAVKGNNIVCLLHYCIKTV